VVARESAELPYLAEIGIGPDIDVVGSPLCGTAFAPRVLRPRLGGGLGLFSQGFQDEVSALERRRPSATDLVARSIRR
jgi:hypothetical protein